VIDVVTIHCTESVWISAQQPAAGPAAPDLDRVTQ
jgi:hypothetical protein